jgi:gliding motility-associated-like protein
MSILSNWKGFFKSFHKATSFLILVVSLILFSGNAHAAKLYFNDIYKATGTSYSIQPSSLDGISFISGSGFKFTSANPADVSFSGNNIAGVLSYTNSLNQQVSIYGVVSRQNKANGNTLAVNFMPTDNSYTTVTGEGYILVIPSKEGSFSNGNNVGTSSDPIASVLNDVLSTQNTSPITSINDVTVNNTDSYAVFTVSLSRAATGITTFAPSLSPVTATLNTDYNNSLQYYNGSAWVNISSSVTIAQGATSIQIRVPILNAGAVSNRTFNLNTGAITGSNVLNSDGAYGIGTILPSPLITTSGTLKTFSTCSGCTVSPQNFTVAGSNLTADILVTAPTGVQVSTSQNTGYQSSVTISQVSNAVTTTTIYVKLTTNSTTVASGVLSVTSTGAISKTLTVTTNTDNAMHFDGTNDYVVLDNVGSNANLAFTGTTNFTLEAWINREANSNTADIISKNNGGVNSNYRLFINSDGKPVFAREASPWSLVGSTVIPVNEWHHVVGVFDGSSMKIYVDGVLSNSVSTTQSVTSSVSAVKVYIGATDNTAGGTTSKVSFFKGKIDEVRIWNTARNLTQIQNSYLADLAGNETGLVAYYNFNQGVLNGTNSINDIINNKTSVANINGALQGFAMSGTSSNFVPGVIPNITASGNATSVPGGNTLQLSNGLTGGVWSTSNNSIATVDASTGLVTGVSAGSISISYTICDKTVAYNLSVTTPTVTFSGSLKTFASCSGCTITAQSFTVSGSNLGSSVTVTAPTGFEVSNALNGTYSSTLSLAITSNALASTSVYARLINNASTASNGNFTVASTGAASKTLTATVNTENALHFDGLDDLVVLDNLGSNGNLAFTGTASFTLEAWVKREDAAGLQMVISKYKGGVGGNYYLALNNGKPLLNRESYPYSVTSDNVLPINEWHHIAGVYDGSNMKLYVDGVLVKTGVGHTGSISSVSTIPVAIGGGLVSGGSPSYMYKGASDEVRIWNTARTSDQIRLNYLTELAGNETGLVAYYKFNQGVLNGTNSINDIITNSTSVANINGALQGFAMSGTTSNFVPGIIPEISGEAILSKGATTNYTNGLTGGTWSSTDTNIATVDPTTGVVTGVNAGTSTITYTLCDKTVSKLVTVVIPTITTSGSLTTFTTCLGTASVAQTFTVSAQYLTANLVLTAPAGYELAASSGGTYSSTLSIAPSSGTVSARLIYVRLSSASINGQSGIVSITSTGATSQSISTGTASVTNTVGGSIAGSATVCSGTNSTVLTLSGETGSITKWQSSLASNFSSITDIANTSASITATNLTATTYYRAVVTLGSCTAANSSVATVTVNPLPSVSVNVIPDVTTSATSFSLPYANLSAGADQYSLTAGTTAMANFVAVSNASITTSPLTISIPASAQNSYDFNLTVKNSSTGCTSVIVPFVLSVSDITPGTVSGDQSICYGSTPATITSLTDASGGGSPTYIWQISTSGHSGTYTDITGATSASYSHPVALTSTTHFRRKATIGVSFAVTHPIEVIVNALPTIAVSPSSASITTGSSVALTASGANTYSWTPSTGLSASNTAAVAATPTVTTTYTVTGTNATTSCFASASVIVTVNSALTAGTISANQTICVGATPASLSSTANATGGTGSIVYEWLSSTNGTTFTTISGANSATYSPGAISVNTYFKRGASTANDAVIYTSPILITVQSSVGGTIAGSAAVCAGTNSTVLTLSGYTGSVTRWQSALAADFSGTVTNINSVSTSITETNLTATKYYRAVVRVGVCAASNSATATITVNALPVISVSPSAPSITSGSNVTLTASGASTYSWTPSTGLSATNTAVVVASPTVTTTYSVSGTSSSCSSTATVTINVTTPTQVADTDGDGVTDAQEAIDGTNPNDGCSYLVASQTLMPTSAWSTADCDGDGTPNGTDTDPKDPCVHAAGATPATTNAIWRAADCDGDGVTNGKETDDGTDPNDGCSYVVASRTLTPTAAWGLLDCDADGNSNATDPNIDAPIANNDQVTVGNTGTATINILTNDDFLSGTNTEITRQLPPNDGTAKGTVTFNPLTGEMTYKRAPFETGLVTMGYKVTNKAVSPPVSALAFVTIMACDLQDPLADCDGDGEPNGTDTAPTDPCVYEPTRQVKANVSDDWKALDCDGDGVINGTELADGTSAADACSFKAGSITLTPSAAWLLLDCDADGVTNQVEGTLDFDGDGIPNCLDTDSDGDSISDKLETIVDTDRDGKPDYLDLDSDNDGILDSVENRACTGTGILCDTDADGKPNFRDLDSDADQISDVIEASGSDYNKDGIADGNINEKGIPSSANKGLTPPDTDRDGKLDPYDVDSDGDGILDYDEEFNEDADFADCDKDGIVNRLDPDECEIFAPQGISPNNDDKNDRLVFKGLVLRKLPNHLSVFNRWGTLVFEMDDYDNSWSGTILPDGTYFYVLDFYGRKPTISNYLAIDRTIK